MSKLISIDNGVTFKTAEEAYPLIAEQGLWDAVVNLMDDDLRERVHAELAPCDERDFLARYLELSPYNLVIG